MKGSVSNPYPGMMKESVSAYRIYGDGTDHEGDIWKSFRGKKQGEYTLKEYEAIPDEYRVELIDGVIYDLNMPTTIHQQLAFEISIKLREYIRQNKGLCMVLPSPVSVQLDEDDRTMIQPDVVICCDREIYGFEDQVPVNIFAGKCQIDFSEICSYIEFLFEKE